MRQGELDIMERAAQMKCGDLYIVSLENLKSLQNEECILLRIQDKEDSTICVPCVLPADSTLSEVCEVATSLIQDLTELGM